MGRLIDADVFEERLMANIGLTNCLDRSFKETPTIDAVEVVRCKECKYWHDHITTTWCSRGAELRPQESGWIKRNADDFCSYGERKETDHE